jgi:hypothetical protein
LVSPSSPSRLGGAWEAELAATPKRPPAAAAVDVVVFVSRSSPPPSLVEK